MVYLEDFRAIPLEDPARATRWLLWHDRSGPYLLDTVVQGTKRHTRIVTGTGRPTFDRFIGSRLSFHNINTTHLAAPIDGAPDMGPDLLKACLQALERAYEPSPLRLRAGRTQEDLRAHLKAFHVIAEDILYAVPVNGICCDYDPDQPIRSWSERKEMLHDPLEPWIILEDIGEWFAPHSISGTEDLANLDSDGKPTPALLDAEEDLDEFSAHELIHHHRLIADFYAHAAPELGLTDGDVAQRLSLLSAPYRAAA